MAVCGLLVGCAQESTHPSPTPFPTIERGRYVVPTPTMRPLATGQPAHERRAAVAGTRGLGLSYSQLRTWFEAARVEMLATESGWGGVSEDAGLAFSIYSPTNDISKAVVTWDPWLSTLEAQMLAMFLIVVSGSELTPEIVEATMPSLRDGTRDKVVRLTDTKRIVFERIVFEPLGGTIAFSATVTAR